MVIFFNNSENVIVDSLGRIVDLVLKVEFNKYNSLGLFMIGSKLRYIYV